MRYFFRMAQVNFPKHSFAGLFLLLLIFLVIRVTHATDSSDSSFLSPVGNSFSSASEIIDHVDMEIIIESEREFSGHLTIELSSPITQTLPIYVLLPFNAKDASTQSQTTQAAIVSFSRDFSALMILLGNSNQVQREIAFSIEPVHISDAQVSGLISNELNTLQLHRTEDDVHILFFKYDILNLDRAFGINEEWTDMMTIPDEIRFRFPAGTNFPSLPPQVTATNILEDPNPGDINEAELLFITTPSFYENRHLRINYVIPSELPPLTDILHTISIIFITLSGALLATGDDLLEKKYRLRISTLLMVIILIVFAINLLNGGLTYLSSNWLELLTVGSTWLLIFGLIIYNYRDKLRWRRRP